MSDNLFIPLLQVKVYTLCGGRFLGRHAAEQPGRFYLDSRTARLPFPRRQVERAVEQLVEEAQSQGLDPNSLPELPNLGVI